MPDGGWERLAALIHAEAARRGSLRALAAAAGLGERTVERLASAERAGYSDRTVVRLEVAMGWREGSVQRVLEGRDPEQVDDLAFARVTEAWPQLSHRDQRVVLALVEALLRR